MNLFDHKREQILEKEKPLAARMRPTSLEEFVGQEHIVAKGRLLRRAIKADQLSSLIFYGPPGTGKTTLASVIANTTSSDFRVLNAVLTGVKDIRKVIQIAKDNLGQFAKRTILFVDEVHRWNKAQQDALLPWVENGTIILIGATTENPYFTVNRPLLSRSRIFQLKPLSDKNLQELITNVLKNKKKGYGDKNIEISDEAIRHIINVANGDARGILNALELAIETTPPNEQGKIFISLGVAEESIQKRAVLYDREGDYHFDTISAFIKSLRGSDPDAAMYWLAKMIYAGEDVRFILRRMLIFSSEDVGLADPNALSYINSIADAFDRVGMPEGAFLLSCAALYLATTEKSNSSFAFFEAMSAVEKEKEGEVPNHLKDANRDKEGFGHGRGYLYPHAYKDHWVKQQYLPDILQGKVFYQPGSLGYENSVAEKIRRHREEQLAALSENPTATSPIEILSFSPADKPFERWLKRTMSKAPQTLRELRKKIYSPLKISRHDRVLLLNDTTAFLSWEAMRMTPEGGVYSIVSDNSTAENLNRQFDTCSDLRSPQIIISEFDNSLSDIAQLKHIHFEFIIARNILACSESKINTLKNLKKYMSPKGATIILAETMPKYTQRLYELLDFSKINKTLGEKLKNAEEKIYQKPKDKTVNWDEKDFIKIAKKTELKNCSVETIKQQNIVHISDTELDRWFSKMTPETQKKSYLTYLSEIMEENDLKKIEEIFRKQLRNTKKTWNFRIALFNLT
ncbi:MAG: AAA family ATPase [Verrucomicrobiota bacterium]|nr:AAA family ATPase [Verrucomicrobiota bacterium]